MAKPTPPISSKQASAWSCGACGDLYANRIDADGCCRCSSCGGKFRKQLHLNQCEGCSWGMAVRNARAAVRRNQESLKSAEDHLARLLRDKAPAKAASASTGEE